MAQKDSGVVRTLKKIGTLRRRVREARTQRIPIKVNDALEYDIIQQSLELLMETINSQSLLNEES